MSTENCLMGRMLEKSNLLQAWQKVRAKRGCAGADGMTIAQFEKGLSTHLAKMRADVVQGNYRPCPLLRLKISSPMKKARFLSIPSVKDRILQSAACQILNPLFEARFEDCSFGYRPARSVKMALQQVAQHRDSGCLWVMDADIKSFFDEIDHVLLLEKVSGIVMDESFASLLRLWVKCEIRQGGRTFLLHRGIPQGAPVSPLLANLYLDCLDKTILQAGYPLVRYADDFLVLCRERMDAEKAKNIAQSQLHALRLQLNHAKTRVVHFDHGFKFLGMEFRGLEQGVQMRPAVQTAPAEARQNLVKADSEPKEKKMEPQIIVEHKTPSVSFAHANAKMSAQLDVGEGGRIPSDPLVRTLYLVEQGCALVKVGERFLVKKSGQELLEVQAIKVDQIMVFGNCTITTPAMNFCLYKNIPIILLSTNGRYYGRVDAMDTAPVLLQRGQFLRAEDPQFSLALAKEFIRGKLRNLAVVLRRYGRNHPAPGLHAAQLEILRYAQKLPLAADLNQLRGYEGAAAKVYFSAWRGLLPQDFGFSRRIRRPPTDPVNALLSFGYTLLFYTLYALVRVRGLNPHVGFLHALRTGHPALISDLMEEFRPIVVDALVLKLVLNNHFTHKDFVWSEAEGHPCLLTDEARKRFINAFENKVGTLPFPENGEDRTDFRRMMREQINVLASVICGQREAYEALVQR